MVEMTEFITILFLNFIIIIGVVENMFTSRRHIMLFILLESI